MKIKFRINLIARVSPHSSSLAQGVGRDPGSELEESTPWPSKNPGENTDGLVCQLSLFYSTKCVSLLIYTTMFPGLGKTKNGGERRP